MSGESNGRLRGPGSEFALGAHYMRLLGARCSTLFDVGVHTGTPVLYRAFKHRPFILVDPVRNCEARLIHRPASYRFVNKAVGSAAGRLMLNEQGGKSSLLERKALTAGTIANRYEVEVTTLDAIIDELRPEPPFGIKIDAEGYELEILKGLSKHAQAVEFLICEVSVRKRFVFGYTFGDLVCLAKSQGFEFANFLNPVRPRPRFYDVAFVCSDHPLLN